MKKKIRIVIYSRKSKFSEKGESIGNQIELCKEYIALHYPSSEYDIEIVIYEDEGYSAGTLERPRFQELLEEERRKPFDILICYRLDRVSRNIADFSSLMNELTRLGTSFVSIKEQFDTKTPMGRAMMYIASVFAQLEREVIAERIRDNMLELAKTGRWLGGDPPAGFSSERYEFVDVYEKGENGILENKKRKACKLITNDEEKNTVMLIFQKYLELKSLSQLELYLLRNGIKTRKGNDFCITTLRAILTNPVYVKNDEDVLRYYNEKKINIYAEEDRKIFDGKHGLISYNKVDEHKRKRPMEEWIIAVGLHEGFIDGIDWIKVQDLLQKNADKRFRALSNNKNNTVFSGIIRCKCCGSYMRPKSGTSKDEDGNTKYYYSCIKKERTRGLECHSDNVYGNEIDKRIIQEMRKIFVPNSEVYKELKKMQFVKKDTKEDEIKNLEKQYKKNEVDIKSVIDKMKYIDVELMEMINDELKRLKKDNEEIKMKLEELNTSKAELKSEFTKEAKTAKFVLNIIDNCFDVFEKFDLKYKKDLMNIFIESAYGNGKKVEINLLNTNIEESKKKVFYATYLSEHKKNNPSVVTRLGEQKIII